MLLFIFGLLSETPLFGQQSGFGLADDGSECVILSHAHVGVFLPPLLLDSKNVK